MKTRTHAIVYLLLFLTLVGGAIVIQLSAPKPLVANVHFDPGTLDLGAPGWAVKEVVVTVWFRGKYDGNDIDPKTLLVEGVLEPKGGWKQTWVERWKDKDLHVNVWALKFQLAGSDLTDLLWQIIVHMGIPGVTADIPLELTGNLYDGTAFTGTGIMNVLIPTTPPNNPPPPP